MTEPLSKLSPEFLKALIKAKMEFPPIIKERENTFFKNGKGKPSKYAGLPEILEAIEPILHKHGFVLYNTHKLIDGGETIIQERKPYVDKDGVCHGEIETVKTVRGPRLVLVTHLAFAETGEEIVADYLLPLIDLLDPQKINSAVTYGKRANATSVNGLSPDDDDDGNAVSGKTQQSQQSQQTQQRPQNGNTPNSNVPPPNPKVEELKEQKARLNWSDDQMKAWMSGQFEGYVSASRLSNKQLDEALNKLRAL